MMKTREVDETGNVSYRITEDGQDIGRVYKQGSGKWRVEPTSGDWWVPVGSVKTGMECLARKLHGVPAARGNYGCHIGRTSSRSELPAALDRQGVAWSLTRVPDGRQLYRVEGEILTPGEVEARYIRGEKPKPKPSGACRCWTAHMHIGLHDGHCCFHDATECHDDPRES
jgi:hypothetical protein